MLDAIARVRDGNEGHRHPAFAEHTLRIPEGDWHALCRLYPALRSRDPAEMSAAWAHFHTTAFAEVYRVGRVFKGVTKNGLILPPLKEPP